MKEEKDIKDEMIQQLKESIEEGIKKLEREIEKNKLLLEIIKKENNELLSDIQKNIEEGIPSLEKSLEKMKIHHQYSIELLDQVKDEKNAKLIKKLLSILMRN